MVDISDDEGDKEIHQDKLPQLKTDLLPLENVEFIERKPRQDAAQEDFYVP